MLPIEAAIDTFTKAPMLETLLLAGSQKVAMPPVGIMTRWDVLQVMGESP